MRFVSGQRLQPCRLKPTRQNAPERRNYHESKTNPKILMQLRPMGAPFVLMNPLGRAEASALIRTPGNPRPQLHRRGYGSNPNTATLFVVPTNTFPFTIVGVMYLFPEPK